MQAVVSPIEPIVLLKNQQRTMLRVFEGCNGLNVMIVFISFIIAFGGRAKQVIVFLVAGCVLLHIFNLLRIILLYFTASYRPSFFYYFHKYFFTAILYLVVFGLWFVWVEWVQMKLKRDDPGKA